MRNRILYEVFLGFCGAEQHLHLHVVFSVCYITYVTVCVSTFYSFDFIVCVSPNVCLFD